MTILGLLALAMLLRPVRLSRAGLRRLASRWWFRMVCAALPVLLAASMNPAWAPRPTPDFHLQPQQWQFTQTTALDQ